MSLAEVEEAKIDRDACMASCSDVAASQARSSICSNSRLTVPSHVTLASAPARLTEKRCFLPSTHFQGLDGIAVTAARLKHGGGDVIVGAGGEGVRVLRSTKLQAQERDIVQLTVSADGVQHRFSVTADHPLATDADGKNLIEAREFLSTSSESPLLVLTGHGMQPVVEAMLVKECTQVVEVVFESSAVVLAWVARRRWRRGSAPPPHVRVACGGAEPTSSDRQQEAGVAIRRGFFDERRQKAYHQHRSLSEDCQPRSPLWLSQGSRRHRHAKPELCHVCDQHQRHLRFGGPPCAHGVECSRCHMPHDEREASSRPAQA